MADTQEHPRTLVSRHCAEGRHNRCLATVYAFPVVEGNRLVKCECPVHDCGHGSDLEKARRRKNEARRAAKD